MIATLDGFGFGGYLDDTAYVDEHGVEWVMTGLKGWYGSPAPDVERTKRPSAHGTYRGVAYRGARTIELSGTLTAPSPALCRAAQRRLAAVCGDETILYTLDVEDEEGGFVSQVELNGEILNDWRDSMSTSVQFSIPLAAPDPRVYSRGWAADETPIGEPGVGGIATGGSGIVTASPGIATGTSGRAGIVQAVNPGTAAMGPVFEIVGGLAAPLGVIEVETGSQLTYAADIEPDDHLWINCDDQPQQPPGCPQVLPPHSVLMDGTAVMRRHLAIWGDWPQLPRGGAPRSYLLTGAASGGSPTLVVHSRPAWR